jgi:hypothetical protein
MLGDLPVTENYISRSYPRSYVGNLPQRDGQASVFDSFPYH